MKQGFTLVEILAVLAILALVTLVSIPATTRLLERNKLKTYETSVKGIIKAAKNNMEADNYKVPRIYTYIGDNVVDNSECKYCEPFYDPEYYSYDEENSDNSGVYDEQADYKYDIDGLTLDKVGSKVYGKNNEYMNLPVPTSGNLENSFGIIEYNEELNYKVQILSKTYCAYKGYNTDLKIGRIKNNVCVIDGNNVTMDFAYPSFNDRGYLVVTDDLFNLTTRFSVNVKS